MHLNRKEKGGCPGGVPMIGYILRHSKTITPCFQGIGLIFQIVAPHTLQEKNGVLRYIGGCY